MSPTASPAAGKLILRIAPITLAPPSDAYPAANADFKLEAALTAADPAPIKFCEAEIVELTLCPKIAMIDSFDIVFS